MSLESIIEIISEKTLRKGETHLEKEQNLNQHQLGGKNNMSYIELYSDQILDAVSLGKTINDFNELNGDYIKVHVFRGESTAVLGTLYSNRLLLKRID